MQDAIVKCSGVNKSYQNGLVKALIDVDLDVPPGAFLTLAGPSGSGKSTLLNLIGALDTPDSGNVILVGKDLITLDENQRTNLRRENIGFIFQDFNLVPVLTARENVELPLEILPGINKEKRHSLSLKMLELVGLSGLEDRYPRELSGGQQQRVAIARALVKKPSIVLADEPTANLDGDTGAQIISLMKEMRDELGTAFIISSHDPRMIEHAEIRVSLIDGRIQT